MVAQSTKKTSGSGASRAGERQSVVGLAEAAGRDMSGAEARGPEGRVAVVCRALEGPLSALSDLVEAASAHAGQSEELRAVLERVGRQAAAVHALVQGALAAESAASACSRIATQDAYTGSSHPGAGGAVRSVQSCGPVDAVADGAELRAPIERTSVVPASAAAIGRVAVRASSPMRRNPLRRKVPGPDDRSALRSLTRRETEVLALVAGGFPSREIAHRLGITPATVRSHIQHILTKLGVCNRRQAAALLAGRLSASARARLRSTRGAAAVPIPLPEPASDSVPIPASQPVAPDIRPSARPAASVSGFARLTRREVQVLRCLAAGLGRSEIAERLYVSPHTARTHIQRVLTKLGVHSVLGAMAIAQTIGLAPAS